MTSLPLPDGFLQPRTKYKWEVLAIERSGNQTLSSGRSGRAQRGESRVSQG